MRTLDVPQANDLDTVRAVVRAVSRGALDWQQVAHFTDYSRRHAEYRLHAARVLGLLAAEGDEYRVTTLGERLLEAERNTDVERAVYYDAIQRSPVLQVLAPDLVAPRGPELETLTQRIIEETDLGRATAERRAGGLLSWRRQVLGHAPVPPPAPAPAPKSDEPEQLSLFG